MTGKGCKLTIICGSRARFNFDVEPVQDLTGAPLILCEFRAFAREAANVVIG
jgi:hypothetical protein